MRRPLLERIRVDVERQGLWPAGARVVAALSGGADSVAQLMLLVDLAATGVVTVAGAAHLDHRLRPEAPRDQAFCQALCERLGVPFVARTVDVAALAGQWRTSIEAAARRARYAFLEDARVELGADRIAVAHTLDDQAETVLLRLLRGAGTRGLRGILPVRGRIVRPLLGCTRAALRADLAARGEAWREDATNADLDVPRNRVRHELLPLLAARYQPAVTRLLARTAAVADAEDALLEALAEEAGRRVVEPAPGGLQGWPRCRSRWRAGSCAGPSRRPALHAVSRSPTSSRCWRSAATGGRGRRGPPDYGWNVFPPMLSYW